MAISLGIYPTFSDKPWWSPTECSSIGSEDTSHHKNLGRKAARVSSRRWEMGQLRSRHMKHCKRGHTLGFASHKLDLWNTSKLYAVIVMQLCIFIISSWASCRDDRRSPFIHRTRRAGRRNAPWSWRSRCFLPRRLFGTSQVPQSLHQLLLIRRFGTDFEWQLGVFFGTGVPD